MFNPRTTVRQYCGEPCRAKSLAPLAVEDEAPTLHGTTRADVCIVGGGFCGLWTAIRLKERDSALDIVAIEAFPERLNASGWRDGMAVSDSRTLVNYYRTTPDGRIAFGTGGGMLAYGNRVAPKFNGETPRSEEVASYFCEIYPDFKDVGTASQWTGPIDRSLSGLPFFGRLGVRADIVYGLGFSGNRVRPPLIGAKMLSSLMLNELVEWSECGLVRDRVGQFPREPLRYFGGSMVTNANRRREALEDQGKTPGALTRYFSKLAPAGLVPVKGIGTPDD